MARGKKKESVLTPEEKLAQALVPDWEQPYKVPRNWCWAKLSSLSALISKGTTPTGGKTAYVSEGVHFLRVENINDDGTISHDSIACVTEEMHAGFLRRSMLEKRDVLVSIAGTLGKTGIVQETDLPLNTNQAVAFIRLKTEAVDERYIKNAIDNPIAQELLLGKTKVTSIPNLTLEIIGDCPIPLAPTAEQRRIVDLIEYLFAKLDEAKEKAQSVLESFETRKAAILHKAFTGELTANWRTAQGVGMESWCATKFRDFCLLKRGFDLPAGQRIKGDYPLVSSSGIIDSHNVAQVKGPGVVTGRSGTIGKVFYIEGDYWPLNTTLYSENLFGNNAQYVCYYLQTFDFKSFSSSTAVPTLNRNLFLDEIVTVPPVDEQQEIVRIINSLLAKEQQAKESAEAMLEKIELLKKSILARAFRGELGTNDPTEESALELLKSTI